MGMVVVTAVGSGDDVGGGDGDGGSKAKVLGMRLNRK